jgi:hypothetical protein
LGQRIIFPFFNNNTQLEKTHTMSTTQTNILPNGMKKIMLAGFLFVLFVSMAFSGFFVLAGCATTTGGYQPDPSIPVESLATLTVADRNVRLTAIDGIETTVNYPRAIKIQPGKHTIICYHQKGKEIMIKMSQSFGGDASRFNYLTEIKFEFLDSRSYELYDASETEITGTLQSTEYRVAIRETAR